MTKVGELDAKIYAVYRKAYEDNPANSIVRLDPNSGILGDLWAEWDRAVETDVDVMTK